MIGQRFAFQATNLVAIAKRPTGRAILSGHDLVALTGELIDQLLPESDIPGEIEEKRVRFQCRNKADLEVAPSERTAERPVVVPARRATGRTVCRNDTAVGREE